MAIFYNLSLSQLFFFIYIFLLILIVVIEKFLKIKSKIVYLLTPLILLFILPSITGRFIVPWYQVKKMEYILNKELPKKVNDVTTLEKITLEGYHIHYFYKLNDTEKKIDFNKFKNTPKQELFDQSLRSTFCNTLAMDKIQDVIVDFTYNGENAKFTFVQDDCDD